MDLIRVMSVMAHQDDFEFNAGGAFARLRQKYGERLQLKILCTTTGASGHHQLSLEETARRRAAEARRSAAILGAEYEGLTCLDGQPLTGQVLLERNLLGGLWNAVRAFEPDFIFCPPVVTDPLAGIHIDHYNTAWAVRMVAYQLTVPHAYPVMGGEAKGRVTYPVIVNVDDAYAGEGECDVVLDVAPFYEQKLRMALCHESQIFEWLPWNSGENEPITAEEFGRRFRRRHTAVNQRYGQDDSVPREYFRLTRWGRKVEVSVLEALFA